MSETPNPQSPTYHPPQHTLTQLSQPQILRLIAQSAQLIKSLDREIKKKQIENVSLLARSKMLTDRNVNTLPAVREYQRYHACVRELLVFCTRNRKYQATRDIIKLFNVSDLCPNPHPKHQQMPLIPQQQY